MKVFSWYKEEHENKKIRVIITQALVRVVIVAGILTLAGLILIQSVFQFGYAYNLIEGHVEDVSNYVDTSLGEVLYDWTCSFAEQLENNLVSIDDSYLEYLVKINSSMLSEINIVDKNGIIIHSSVPEYIGWDMRSGEQGTEFLCLLNGEDYYEQVLRPNDYDKPERMVYAGKAFTSGEGFVQLGMSEELYDDYLDSAFSDIVRYHRVGSSGIIMICDRDLDIIGCTDNLHVGEKFNRQDLLPPEEVDINYKRDTIYGKKSYIYSAINGDYFVIGIYPVDEAVFFGSLDTVLIVIMNSIMLFCVFKVLSRVLNKQVVNGIEEVNASLEKISGGSLEERVDVHSSLEFDQFSVSINAAVDKLEKMIAEESARIDQELATAKGIQLISLPDCTEAFRHNKRFELYASMETAKTVGGDYYDFYMLSNDILVVTIADVSDKGIPAAMFMMRAKTLMNSLAREGLSIDEMAAATNKGLWENNEGSMFVTAWIGFMDLKTGVVRYVHAGHTCPVLFGNGRSEFVKKKRDMLLGGIPDVTYHAQEFVMKPRDALFLYTDGVTEAEGPGDEQFGNDRLLSFLSDIGASFDENGETEYCEFICNKVIEETHSFRGDIPQSDDITVLCVRYLGC